ncbi:MAG: Tex-like N-terminal domain-containing protein [Planctomycetia bacterium]|nr:Tex-like N-terminal domain-containing protein [Planctomycetia bacterium]
MTEPVAINFRFIAHETNLSPDTIQTVINLFKEEHPVPFIARYRKDQTGNLDADVLRKIESLFLEQRQLAERKETILRSIDSLGKLTPNLDKKIREARTSRRLEDIYLPYKPKKQTLASAAREKGLEPFAIEILEANETAFDLSKRAADFINEEKGLLTVEDVLAGVGYIISEMMSEKVELRSRIRELIQRSGKIISTLCETSGSTENKTIKPDSETRNESIVDNTKTSTEDSINLNESSETVGAEPPSSPEQPVLDNVSQETQPNLDLTAPENSSPASDSDSLEQKNDSKTVLPDENKNLDVSLSDNPSSEVKTDPNSVAEPISSTDPQPAASNTTPEKTARKQDSSRKKKSAKDQKQEQLVKQFADYFNFKSEIRLCPPHRILAINRGERSKILKVKLDFKEDQVRETAQEIVISPDHPHQEYLSKCLNDALTRLLLPSLEREIRRDLTDHAEEQAIQVFAKNLKNLLLQKPLLRRRVLAIDPGFKNGCKITALDEFGNFLAYDTIFINGSQDRKARAMNKICDLIEKYNLSIIAIGNGTGCRETEEFIANLIATKFAEKDIAYIIVNEAGASVYSVSPTAKEEFPNYDPYVRGAIFIGRRLQDPLNELVKIEPGSLGVGMYQHDIKPKRLKDSLTRVVEAGVNYVGVDLNSATPAILRYVSGLNQLTAKRIYEYRIENGPFRKREQLLNVPGFGKATYMHSAGFLKIHDGYEPLDTTWIHPESYDLANKILEKLGFSTEDLRSTAKRTELATQIASVDAEALAKEFETGVYTVRDILDQFVRPGRDPREELPSPIFKKGIMKIEDLSVGMELTGTVLNVVDFGAFVDIGLHESGLIHISHMGDRFVHDSHQCVTVGDIVKVWVIEVDPVRHRISLSLLPPGTERHLQRDRKQHRNESEYSSAQSSDQRKDSGEPKERNRSNNSERTTSRKEESSRNQNRSDSDADRRSARRSNDRKSDNRSENRERFDRGKGRDYNRSKTPRVVVAAPKEKKLTPISENMKKGKEPLRSFSDLAQLFGRVQVTTQPSKDSTKIKKTQDNVVSNQNNMTTPNEQDSLNDPSRNEKQAGDKE